MKDFGLKKLYYSISEVSKLTGLEQYILRYWETEFEQLKPGKNRAGNRIYTNKDIKLILQIKRLLREEKYTIEGAKKILTDFDPNVLITSSHESVDKQKSTAPRSLKKDLEEVKAFLQYIQATF
ncbi:MAG: MerR family transcriptional regulator [Bacteroidetes bacterium]|nr:MerR family transcriptional regulator [Bacteroidota bacterium]MCL6098297.1 MerR family transcriptional regulator [Bacteroidota bacterium]